MQNSPNQNQTLNVIYKYFSFWPLFLFCLLLSLLIAFIIIRYTDPIYSTNSKIQIIDKAMDSEMALPTAMTIFNRSTINLENETEILKSNRIIAKTVKQLKSNVDLYSIGKIKNTINHKSEWINGLDYELDFKFNLDEIVDNSKYIISFENNSMKITKELDSISFSTVFNGYSTKTKDHDLPFEFKLSEDKTDNGFKFDYGLQINTLENTIEKYQSLVKVTKIGTDSDMLKVEINNSNHLIAREFIDQLVDNFDRDGITDRQLVYKRTIDFVDSRYDFLKSELNKIEIQKQKFKESTELTDINYNASISFDQKLVYDNELFDFQSQLDLTNLLKESINEDYELMPVNIGVNNDNINILIKNYNDLIVQRNRLIYGAGKSNTFLNNLENQIFDLRSNILLSIQNFQNSLNLSIKNLDSKESEFKDFYDNIPQNEKQLRSIEREQEIKEALFLLLLQKREEASINYAVTKPSIKIIDSAITNFRPIYPNKIIFFSVSIIVGLLLPFILIYGWILFDTKIHTKIQLMDLVKGYDIPIIGEIPYVNNIIKTSNISKINSRDTFAESIRMLVANLNFTSLNNDNVILVTSSVKGEGKTLVSTNFASFLTSKYKKVLLVGADLRNPQIHKFLKVKKSVPGLSEIIYRNEKKWDNYIIKHNNLDIILSGVIPPNPTQLLSSDKFSNFINDVKKNYDYVVIDSAPCLLVSDTFEISKYVGTTLYVVRCDHSESKLVDFINECKKSKKLENINLVLNSVGNSKMYGYRYGYKYGYKYGYQYSYNYGYGYGYSSKNS